MGIFDKIFSKTAAAYAPANEQEAWMSLMYACVAVDGNISEVETNQIAHAFTYKRLFQGSKIGDLYAKAHMAHQEHGSKKMIDSCVPVVASDKKDTLFCLLVEMLLSDGNLAEAEKEIIEYAATALKIDETFSEKVVEVMLTRNRGSYMIVD